MAALREQSAAAMKECGEKFPPGNPKNAVARAQCVNAAFAILAADDALSRPIAGLHGRSRCSSRGHPSRLDIDRTGNAILAHKWSDLVVEEQRRRLANRAVTAQEESASAAS
jgi:hypothetical protein